jgi:prevent-host-death family protein
MKDLTRPTLNDSNDDHNQYVDHVNGGGEMQTLQASEFKAKCLAVMDDVSRTGEVLVITKNGKPVAELRPYSGGKADSPFGLHPRLAIVGDVVSPI